MIKKLTMTMKNAVEIKVIQNFFLLTIVAFL